MDFDDIDNQAGDSKIEDNEKQMKYSSIVIRAVLALATLCVILFVILELIQEVNLFQITPVLALYTAFLFTITFMLRSVRWKLIQSHQGTEISLLDSTTMVYSAHFYNMILPARTGESSRYYFLRQYGISLSSFGGALILEYALDFSLIILFGLLVSIVLITRGLLTFESILLLAICGAVLLIGIGLMIGINRYLKRDLEDSPSSRTHGLRTMIYEISNIRGYMGNDKLQFFKLFSVSIPIWVGELSFIWFVARLIGYPISIEFAILSGAIGAVAQALPILPGSWGSYEIVVSIAITAAGFPIGVAFTLAVIDHFFRYSYNLIAGFPFVTHLLSKNR